MAGINTETSKLSSDDVRKLGVAACSPALEGDTPRTTEQTGLVGERLHLEVFHQFCGQLAGHPFVKTVWDCDKGKMHFVNNHKYPFHADYVAEQIMGIPKEDLRKDIDRFNKRVYLSPERNYYLALLALHQQGDKKFFTLETVEIDNMDSKMLLELYHRTQETVDPSIPIYFKPANHLQEAIVADVDPMDLPRMFNHELYTSSDFVPLHEGTTHGRLRWFDGEKEYRDAFPTIQWHDIVVMDRVPDDIPRVAGIINTQPTTPLSHTNVLASGWMIPNCIQVGLPERVQKEGLNNQWVEYGVERNASTIVLKKIDGPFEFPQKPSWTIEPVHIEEPETYDTPIRSLSALRMNDRFKYGTKAANLGELLHINEMGSSRLLGFYRVKRPPRDNLMEYIAEYLQAPVDQELGKRAWAFLRKTVKIPEGIAIPFSFQQKFLESSPKIQQQIGRLKMALELGTRDIDPICVRLQQMIRSTRIPFEMRDEIDSMVAENLGGTLSFVVRSSSNAEDLENFSAAGIYESINHVTTADNIFESIKEVWASLISPRSVRLRNEVGISLDDAYMGVIIQEEVQSSMGGVLVTTNPTAADSDFRNVYINVSPKSVVNVVSGTELPLQYLFNTVEGGGRTLSLGTAGKDLPPQTKQVLQDLAFAGRLLQSHFSRDYTFSAPQDIEWAYNETDGIYLLQLRPYTR